jgi:DNA replication and repair protein RecF
MFLRTLYLKDFRLFKEHCFSFSPSCNIFYGNNGVGKTTILEAIGYLGRGKSFRTCVNKKLINIDKSHCLIRGELKKNDYLYCIGIKIDKSSKREIHLNGKTGKNTIDLASLVPLIWIHFNNLHLFLGSPALRRQFLDWGVFHHRSDFYLSWKSFNKVLQQRNHALKKKQSDKQVLCWNYDFIYYGKILHKMRRYYVDLLNDIVTPYIMSILDTQKVSIKYYKGWGDADTLEESLEKNLNHDRRLGYTQNGPQRADIQLWVENKPAQDFCSQGQHKLISYIFYITQGILFSKKNKTVPIILIDDLPSELDSEKTLLIGALLRQLMGQIFISGVEKRSFKKFSGFFDVTELFHVEHITKTGKNVY